MEPTDDVLVVIQAESGEEIALPLAALDEQHQEVIVDGGACTSRDVMRSQNDTLENNQLEPISKPEQAEKAQEEPVKVLKPKQKRKQKLIYLPLSEEDLKLDFQVIDEPSPQANDDTKKKPRREYRTRKKLAALESANNDNEVTIASPMIEADESQSIKDSSQVSSQAKEEQEEQRIRQDHENRAEHGSPRRTRLSNACRVATSKFYKCTECDFTTDRINNIVMHIRTIVHKT